MNRLMLEALATEADITYPKLASPELDGVRCAIINEQPLIEGLVLIPNRVVRDMLTGLPSMDGVLTIGEPRGEGVRERTYDGISNDEGAPKFTFWVFDAMTTGAFGFAERLALVTEFAKACGKHVQPVPHKLIETPAQLLEYEAAMLLAGYGAIMLRDPEGPYKHGRSTLQEGWLLKLKREGVDND